MATKKDKKYWEQKIVYALSKIDYAKSRIENRDMVNERSKTYSVLLSYGGNAKLETIMQLTELPKEIIVSVLQELKALNLLNWDGRLGKKKVVKANKNAKVVYQGIKDGNLNQKVVGFGFDDSGNLIHPNKPEQIVTESKQKVAKSDENWVEMDYSEDVILRVRKKKLKEALL